MIRQTCYIPHYIGAMTTAFNPITVIQTMEDRENDHAGSEANAHIRRRLWADGIFGKREVQGQAQERADRFIDAHSGNGDKCKKVDLFI